MLAHDKPCGACFHWALPFAFAAPAMVGVVRDIVVQMEFGQWLLYHLHITMHMRNQWQGELVND